MELLHYANIIVHIVFGLAAMLLGLFLLMIKKGNQRHVKFGRIYLKTICVVIVTGLAGVLVFKQNIFLLVVTILSGYTAWSGVRTLRLKSTKLQAIDYAIPVIAMITASGYMLYLRQAGLFWAPVVTISILSALILVTVYDLLRTFMGTRTRQKLMLPEHIYKMTSSFIALTSAFAGTVFANYKPYSQILPGLLGWLYIVGAIIYYTRRNNKKVLTNTSLPSADIGMVSNNHS